MAEGLKTARGGSSPQHQNNLPVCIRPFDREAVRFAPLFLFGQPGFRVFVRRLRRGRFFLSLCLDLRHGTWF
jgi:hypothetical protein